MLPLPFCCRFKPPFPPPSRYEHVILQVCAFFLAQFGLKMTPFWAGTGSNLWANRSESRLIVCVLFFDFSISAASCDFEDDLFRLVFTSLPGVRVWDIRTRVCEFEFHGREGVSSSDYKPPGWFLRACAEACCFHSTLLEKSIFFYHACGV